MAEENANTTPVRSRRRPLFLSLVAIGLLACIVVGLQRRTGFHASDSKPESLPVVAVSEVLSENLTQTLTVAAEFRPYQQVALYAKVSGFLQSISVDVGDQVTEGQTLASLDAPELKNEQDKATAAYQASLQEVLRAEAHFHDVNLANTRLIEVAKQRKNLVAQQELDDVQAKAASSEGALAACQQRVKGCEAELEKARAMVRYTTIVAPFAGTITKRFFDLGALIPASASSTSKAPVLDLADVHRLRLVFPIPQSSVPFIRVGATANIFVSALGITIPGQVSRFSGLVERATRTMETEIEVDNADGRLTPGMYASVTLMLHERKGATSVPVQAVFGGEKSSALVLTAAGVIEKRSLTLGLQTPSKAEVLTGLQVGERVLVGSRSGIHPGQKASPKLLAPTPVE
jgi:RND family efflux transporter MFP subunit